MSLERLRLDLTRADTALDELDRLLAEERDLIEKRSADALENLAARKLACLQRLQAAEPLGGLSSAQAIDAELSACDDSSLQDQWRRFRERLWMLREANERNGLAIQGSLKGAEAELTLLHGGDGETANGTYRADGSAGARSRRAIRTRA